MAALPEALAVAPAVPDHVLAMAVGTAVVAADGSVRPLEAVRLVLLPPPAMPGPALALAVTMAVAAAVRMRLAPVAALALPAMAWHWPQFALARYALTPARAAGFHPAVEAMTHTHAMLEVQQ